MNRIERLQQILTDKQASACFLTNQKNIFYLTGFRGISPYERESTLLVTKQEAYLFVPAMYRDSAEENTKKDFVTIVSSLPKGLFGSWIKYAPTGTILCEATNLTLAEFEYMQTQATLSLLPTKHLVENLRMIKDAGEIHALTKAAHIADKTFTHIKTFVQKHINASITEHDIVEEIRHVSQSLGSEGFGFDPIVAVGAGSAEPHYLGKNNPITPNQPLLIDMGFIVNGYTSDFTRTIYLGKPSDTFTRMYTFVQEAQQACLNACKPGASTTALYNISKQYFTERGVNELYLHSLGHGVGLDIHEAPRLSKTHDTILQPGMVITIEPGLYLKDQFGIRIEDLVHITEDGCDVLTTTSKDLLSLV